jgi:hypothetical protein
MSYFFILLFKQVNAGIQEQGSTPAIHKARPTAYKQESRLVSRNGLQSFGWGQDAGLVN